MPLFYSLRRRSYAIVSYKALFSQFTRSPEWKPIGERTQPRHVMRALARGEAGRVVQVVRHPVARVESCFRDKYRKQPERIGVPGFAWQACHEILYPYLDLRPTDPAERIAERFLAFSFAEFVALLPEVYDRDPHFSPQAWEQEIRAAGRSWGRVRPTLLRVEDETAEIEARTGLDLATKTNATDHIERDYVVDAESAAILARLYREDFPLGEYPLPSSVEA